MPTSISRNYTFSAAHRIEGHPKCGRLHGHNYRVTVSIVSETFHPSATNHGMLLDYGDLDRTVKPIVDAMDHRYLVSEENLRAEDPYAKIAMGNGDAYELPSLASTAECIAEKLFIDISAVVMDMPFPLNHACIAVRVDETDKSSAMVNND